MIINPGCENVPIAPKLNSKKRFQVIKTRERGKKKKKKKKKKKTRQFRKFFLQAVQLADTAKWNLARKDHSLPVGLIGVLKDSELELVFDEQLEDLKKRNKEVATLLLVQREELAVATAREYEKKVVDETVKQLKRQNSLILNEKIAESIKHFAAESEAELREAHEEIRFLKQELHRITAERDFLLKQVQEIKDQFNVHLRGDSDSKSHN